MELKIMEWNINQRLNHSKADIPEWIADVIRDNKVDIVILTECYKGNNWEIVKKKAFDGKYAVFESNNYQGENNDVVIAVNTEKITAIYAKTYFSCDHSVPDHLEVKCKSKEDGKEILIIGMRIHAAASDPEKEKEMQLILDGVADEKIVIIGGDFNNYRRGYNADGHWHMNRIDEIIRNKFVRKTPDGSSIYEEHKSNDDYAFAEDHFLIKGVETENFKLEPYDRSFFNNDKKIYKWGKDFQIYIGKDKTGKSMHDNIPDPYPDHAILKAMFRYR